MCGWSLCTSNSKVGGASYGDSNRGCYVLWLALFKVEMLCCVKTQCGKTLNDQDMS